MKRKVAIRKLNRTLLKKEGTKEIYITGKSMMSFFGYNKLDDLPTSRKNESAKKRFIDKRTLYDSSVSEMLLSVTKENNEVRLTGFDKYFVINDIKEVDQIVMECVCVGSETKYFLDYIKCINTRVLQEYDKKDSSDNYNINWTRKGSIQLKESEQPREIYKGLYWLWDDSFDQERWNELTEKELLISFIAKGKVQKKIVRIIKTGHTIKKIMKAKTSSSNQLEFQLKHLYRIIEFSDNKWVEADFSGVKLLEFTDGGSRVKITDRNANSFCLFEGEVIK